jgi:Tol biopolymer transport system component
MGEVYRARDVTLGREVALKLLRERSANRPDGRDRFEREARLLATLQHPGIATIHESFEEDGVPVIVMELVDGETLDRALADGPLPMRRALDVARQIAEALEAAHGKAILHRDLKPSNVKLTPEGRVKLLDFGLAKALTSDGLPSSVDTVTTPGDPVTDSPAVLGTAPYMSPEQARGDEMDQRTDVWAFGCVLYEMLTGRRVFPGGTHADAVAGVLEREPDWAALPATTPEGVLTLLRRCLEKDRAQRLRHIGDARLEIEDALARPRGGYVPRRLLPRRLTSRLAGVMAVALLLGGAVRYFTSRWDAASSLSRLINPMPVAASVGLEGSPSWSPDGRMLAYHLWYLEQPDNWDIWVTQLDGGPPVNRTADHAGYDGQPRWSPDGRQIAFWSTREGGGVFLMSALGGHARKIASTYSFAHPPAWSPDGSELAYLVALPDARIGVERRHLSHGTTRRFPLPGRERVRLDFAWSPDGRLLAYVDAYSYGGVGTQLWILRWDDGQATAISDGQAAEWRPSWAPDSRTLYFVSSRSGTKDIWRQGVSGEGKTTTAERLTTGLEVLSATASGDGRRLAYVKGRRVANIWRVPILADRPATWADAHQLTFDQAVADYVDVTRDGRRLVISSDRSGKEDLWLLPANGGEMQQFSSGPTPHMGPAWSPDGREIAFYVFSRGSRSIWVQDVAGGPARQLTRDQSLWPRWSPDGKTIAYTSLLPGGSGIWVVPTAGGAARAVVADPSAAQYNDWSPDGEWLAFTSNRSGQNRIWRVLSNGGRVEAVSTKDGSTLPRWSRDGKWIYFRQGGPTAQQVWGVAVNGRTERPFTNFSGKRGYIDDLGLATDGKNLFFSWREDLADIWVMDVVER